MASAMLPPPMKARGGREVDEGGLAVFTAGSYLRGGSLLNRDEGPDAARTTPRACP
jgi:hypothetical protein